ncbi:hypothetical protein [Bacillus sp. SM2101]|uniref:hypothetical protein n=1 Tax=Bacillus sp. SM2101 TaxID=2805366 RepID=UPI001BDE40DF|nr:hypothetical protein [Bacillus sp. SM2101]
MNKQKVTVGSIIFVILSFIIIIVFLSSTFINNNQIKITKLGYVISKEKVNDSVFRILMSDHLIAKPGQEVTVEQMMNNDVYWVGGITEAEYEELVAGEKIELELWLDRNGPTQLDILPPTLITNKVQIKK